MMWNQFIDAIQKGDVRSIARSISLVENEVAGYEDFLSALPEKSIPIIGITGPPGAGKSTLTDAITAHIIQRGKKVAIICVDPSSPFHQGAILGDRIRMSRWYNNENVYIRSLATRGALGGLHPKIIEITEVLKVADFDYILIETVGVGQSEVEIAGLADITMVVLVPEAGDDIQTMKSGLMEIADMFVVNKADRPGSTTMIKNLRMMVHDAAQNKPIVATQANQEIGIENLINSVEALIQQSNQKEIKNRLLVDKMYWIIQQHRMKDIQKDMLYQKWQKSETKNIYRFLQEEHFI